MSPRANDPKPLSRRTVGRAFKERPALADNLARATKSIFVAGGDEKPKVRTKVIPVERVRDGQKSLHYEIRVEVDGFRLGEHASPPPMKGNPVTGDDTQDDAHQIIRHQADVFPGQSGGPMFGFWNGDVGPRAVAVQSWQNSATNGASGGGDLVDLAIRARSDHP